MTSITTGITGGTAAFFDKARTGMGKLRAEAEKLQSQVDTGERLTRSSDDPLAASRLRTLSRAQALSKVDAANADRAATDLALTDSTMSDMADAIVRAQTLAMQAANGTLNDSQRSAIAAELDQIHGGLLSLANTRDSSGNALFGGKSTGDAYQVNAAGHATYIGTASAEEVSLGEGQSVSRGMTGPQVLSFTDKNGSATDVMATLKALSDALKTGGTAATTGATDALASLQTGLDTLTTAQTVVGARLSWIDQTGDRRTDLAQARSTEQTAIGETDLASTVIRLQETLTVLDASQASFSRLASLSLFDQLR